MLQKFFFDWSIDIFQSVIDYIKFSTEPAVCKICSKYTNGIILRFHPHRVTKWHYVTVEQKENVSWTVNVKLWTQFMTFVSVHQSHKKSTLSWERENGSEGIITIKNLLMQMTFPWDNTFRLCIASRGNFRCNS